MVSAILVPLNAYAADSDGDGIEDSLDDCPWASGDSTIDRDGCPDRDGDGTSDFNDGWAIGNPNFQNEFTTTSNSDYYSIDFSPDGEMIITGLQFISRGESPRNIQDQLVANLPPKEKQKLLEAAAGG